MPEAAARRAEELSDAELAEMARRGNSAALGAVLDRHRVALFARALGWLGEREAAADAVQEAFVIALRSLDQLQDPAKVGGWLHAILRSVCAMQLSVHGARRSGPVRPDLHPGRAGTSSAGAVLRGQDELRRWCEQGLTDRVGYRLTEAASGAGSAACPTPTRR